MNIKKQISLSIFIALAEKTRAYRLLIIYMFPILFAIFPIVNNVSINGNQIGWVGVAALGFMTGLVAEGLFLVANETLKSIKNHRR